MWAIGAYTNSDQAAMNTSIAENFMRSANAPAISAGVMAAKVSWNMAYTVSGMVIAKCDTDSLFAGSCMKVMPLNRARLEPPRNLLPGVKAQE